LQIHNDDEYQKIQTKMTDIHNQVQSEMTNAENQIKEQTLKLKNGQILGIVAATVVFAGFAAYAFNQFINHHKTEMEPDSTEIIPTEINPKYDDMANISNGIKIDLKEKSKMA
jgi:hypothetical protein